MTTPAELQAIRERDAAMDKPGEQEFAAIAFIDRRTLLALYDAQSDEVRRLREALRNLVVNSHVYESDHADDVRIVDDDDYEAAKAVVGSQP